MPEFAGINRSKQRSTGRAAPVLFSSDDSSASSPASPLSTSVTLPSLKPLRSKVSTARVPVPGLDCLTPGAWRAAAGVNEGATSTLPGPVQGSLPVSIDDYKPHSSWRSAANPELPHSEPAVAAAGLPHTPPSCSTSSVADACSQNLANIIYHQSACASAGIHSPMCSQGRSTMPNSGADLLDVDSQLHEVPTAYNQQHRQHAGGTPDVLASLLSLDTKQAEGAGCTPSATASAVQPSPQQFAWQASLRSTPNTQGSARGSMQKWFRPSPLPGQACVQPNSATRHRRQSYEGGKTLQRQQRSQDVTPCCQHRPGQARRRGRSSPPERHSPSATTPEHHRVQEAGAQQRPGLRSPVAGSEAGSCGTSERRRWASPSDGDLTSPGSCIYASPSPHPQQHFRKQVIAGAASMTHPLLKPQPTSPASPNPDAAGRLFENPVFTARDAAPGSPMQSTMQRAAPPPTVSPSPFPLPRHAPYPLFPTSTDAVSTPVCDKHHSTITATAPHTVVNSCASPAPGSLAMGAAPTSCSPVLVMATPRALISSLQCSTSREGPTAASACHYPRAASAAHAPTPLSAHEMAFGSTASHAPTPGSWGGSSVSPRRLSTHSSAAAAEEHPPLKLAPGLVTPLINGLDKALQRYGCARARAARAADPVACNTHHGSDADSEGTGQDSYCTASPDTAAAAAASEAAGEARDWEGLPPLAVEASFDLQHLLAAKGRRSTHSRRSSRKHGQHSLPSAQNGDGLSSSVAERSDAGMGHSRPGTMRSSTGTAPPSLADRLRSTGLQAAGVAGRTDPVSQQTPRSSIRSLCGTAQLLPAAAVPDRVHQHGAVGMLGDPVASTQPLPASLERRNLASAIEAAGEPAGLLGSPPQPPKARPVFTSMPEPVLPCQSWPDVPGSTFSSPQKQAKLAVLSTDSDVNGGDQTPQPAQWEAAGVLQGQAQQSLPCPAAMPGWRWRGVNQDQDQQHLPCHSTQGQGQQPGPTPATGQPPRQPAEPSTLCRPGYNWLPGLSIAFVLLLTLGALMWGTLRSPFLGRTTQLSVTSPAPPFPQATLQAPAPAAALLRCSTTALYEAALLIPARPVCFSKADSAWLYGQVPGDQQLGLPAAANSRLLVDSLSSLSEDAAALRLLAKQALMEAQEARAAQAAAELARRSAEQAALDEARAAAETVQAAVARALQAEHAQQAAEAVKALTAQHMAQALEEARLAAEAAAAAEQAQAHAAEQARLEAERARIAIEVEKAEKARLAVEAEELRLAAEAAEQARLELEAERAEQARLAAEAEAAAQARVAAEAERAEQARLAAEAVTAAAARQAAARRARIATGMLCAASLAVLTCCVAIMRPHWGPALSRHILSGFRQLTASLTSTLAAACTRLLRWLQAQPLAVAAAASAFGLWVWVAQLQPLCQRMSSAAAQCCAACMPPAASTLLASLGTGLRAVTTAGQATAARLTTICKFHTPPAPHSTEVPCTPLPLNTHVEVPVEYQQPHTAFPADELGAAALAASLTPLSTGRVLRLRVGLENKDTAPAYAAQPSSPSRANRRLSLTASVLAAAAAAVAPSPAVSSQATPRRSSRRFSLLSKQAPVLEDVEMEDASVPRSGQQHATARRLSLRSHAAYRQQHE